MLVAYYKIKLQVKAGEPSKIKNSFYNRKEAIGVICYENKRLYVKQQQTIVTYANSNQHDNSEDSVHV